MLVVDAARYGSESKSVSRMTYDRSVEMVPRKNTEITRTAQVSVKYRKTGNLSTDVFLITIS